VEDAFASIEFSVLDCLVRVAGTASINSVESSL
jgi:hypothetical protein